MSSPLLWERMDESSAASSSRVAATTAASSSPFGMSSSVGGGGEGFSPSSSPSRSCLTLPLPLRRGKHGTTSTPTAATAAAGAGNLSTPFRNIKKRSMKKQQQPSGGGGGLSPLNNSSSSNNNDLYDPYDMSAWETFPYDNNNNAAAPPTAANDTTATTAAMSWNFSPSTTNQSLSMTSKEGGGFAYNNSSNNNNNNNSHNDASMSSWNFSAASRSSPSPGAAAAGRGGTTAEAPPSTTSSSSSSSSHYSAANTSPAGQQPQHQQNPATTTNALAALSRTDFMEHLLTPPTPQDRASVPRRRQAYEQEQRQKKILQTRQQQRRGLYDGEIEPEGIRGQEAAPPPSATSSTRFVAAAAASPQSSSLPAMRTFSNDPNKIGHSSPAGKNNRSPFLLSAIPEDDAGSRPRVLTMKLAPSDYSSNGDDDGSRSSSRFPADEQESSTTRAAAEVATGGPPPSATSKKNDEISPKSGCSSKSSTSISSPELYREFVASKEKQERQRREQQHQQQQQMGEGMRLSSSPSLAAASAPLQFQTSTGQAVRGDVVVTSNHDDDDDNYYNEDDDDDDDDDDYSDSTQSDDELRRMQADLIPTASPLPPQQQGQEERFETANRIDHQHDNNNTAVSKTRQQMDPERPSPAAAAAAATAARAVAAQQQALPRTSSSSSPRFWSSNRSNNSSINHSHEEDLSHSDVNIGMGTTSAAANNNNNQDDSNAVAVDALNLLAMEYVNRNEFGDAIATFMQVLKRQQEHYGDISPAAASAWHNLGTVYAKRVAALQRQLEEQQQQRSTPNTIGTAPTPVVQLELEQRTARQAALEAFQAAARTARDSLSSTHPNVAVSLVRIGFLLLQSRQYQNAVITFEEALRIRLHHYGPKHALVANLHNNLGVCHMHLGNFKQGRQSLLEGLTIQRQLVLQNGKGEPKNGMSDNGRQQWVHWMELADTLFNLGGLCLEWIRKQGPDLRRVEEAESSFSEALQIRIRVLGPDDPSVIQLREMLSMAKSIPRPHPRSLSPQPPYYSQRATTPRVPRNLVSAIPSETSSSTTYGYKPTTTRKGTGMMMSGSRNNQSLMTADDTADFSAPESPSSLMNNTISPDHHSLGQLEVSSIMNSDANPQSEDSAWNDIIGERAPRSIFGAGVAEGRPAKGANKDVLPPVSEVRVSNEEEEELPSHLDQQANRSYSSETRIYVAPHLVPDSPTSNRHQKDDSQIVVTNKSLEETLDLDTSNELMDSARSPKSFSYDAEESCMINDVGVDSEHGRIHYPLAWTKVEGSLATTACRDIVVTRPFRTGGLKTSENPVKATDISYSTGNESRDDVMARARALLDAHGQVVKRWSPSGSEVDSEGEGEDFVDTRNVAFDEDYLMEDGLAPLGGSWSLPRQVWEKPRAVAELLADPMNNLPDIHQEATKQLLANNFVDSLPLFSIILQCQRRRNGAVHADVAAALHNVAMCQLRANNHDEALQAFEESARIRKGSLGRDHPLVAVSLVKVGITLLLLHRFEDALWSFREALSVRKHALGPLHPSTARIYNNIGCVHVEFNEFREARRAFEAALDIQRNAICHDPDSGPLLFGAATTLCNLGYLYRYRDLHEKAALVLKEAAEMQETVLGESHATVLSTLDNLADSCANCGQTPEALRFYNTVLKRFRVGGRTESQKVLHAEAVLLYKISRVHRQRNDHANQLDALKFALRSIRAHSDTGSMNGIKPDTLERRILYDIRACREQMEKEELNWV